VGPTTPRPQGPRFGLGRVRSPLLAPSRLISLPPGTEMFQFPGFASLRRVMTGLAPRRVAPFGHPGLTACVRLPLAYRSLPRPSSPPCAQASPTYLRSLDYISRPSRARAIYTSDAFRQWERRGKPPPLHGFNCNHRMTIRHPRSLPTSIVKQRWPTHPAPSREHGTRACQCS
jgi:hypothetical protein